MSPLALILVALGLVHVVGLEEPGRACTLLVSYDAPTEGERGTYKSIPSSQSCPWGCSGTSSPALAARQSGSG